MRTASAVLDPVQEAAPPPAVHRTKSIREARDLEIENAIVHIIDHRPDQGLVLSEAELPAYPGSPLSTYFIEQIENILQDAETAEAKFLDATQGAPPRPVPVSSTSRRSLSHGRKSWLCTCGTPPARTSASPRAAWSSAASRRATTGSRSWLCSRSIRPGSSCRPSAERRHIRW